MINHFPTETAAKAHLIAKGFEQAPTGGRWISRDGLVDAWITTDPHRGTYITFIA